MQSLRYVYELACEATHNALPACGSAKHEVEEVNVWWNPLKRRLDRHVRAATEEDFFAVCFWLSVFSAVFGVYEAVGEFVCVYSDKINEPRTLWNRKYRHIPLGLQRLGRGFGSALNIVVNLLLLFSLTSSQPDYHLPWIIVNALIIVFEMTFWVIQTVASKSLNLRPLASIAFLTIRFAVIVNVTMVVANVMRD